MQLRARFHWVRYGPKLIKTETADNRLDIRSLTQRDGAFISVPRYLDPEQPVELAQIGDLNVLPDVALKLINFIQGLGSDGAIVNVDNDNNELTGRPASEVNSLVDRTLGETQLVNKDLYQPLVPTAPTLLQTVQGLSETTDLVGVIDGFETRGLAHVYHFVVGECAVEICAFDINLMEL